MELVPAALSYLTAASEFLEQTQPEAIESTRVCLQGLINNGRELHEAIAMMIGYAKLEGKQLGEPFTEWATRLVVAVGFVHFNADHAKLIEVVSGGRFTWNTTTWEAEALK